jgi:hypothetical protein
MHQRGSQWMIVAGGDPEILALDIGEGYVYALGDATNLYNSEAEFSTDIVHASRSIVWLQPDHIVVYDRAESKTEGRFKRFWLNLPSGASTEETVSTMTTASGQQLVVSTLLPEDAEITAEPAESLEETGEVAAGEPMQFRLRIEAPGGPASARFLHVLQGVDAGSSSDSSVLIESDSPTPFVGALVRGTVVLFPFDLGTTLEEVTYSVPADTDRHLITGLAPRGTYESESVIEGTTLIVTIRPGTDLEASEGGVLVLDLTS